MCCAIDGDTVVAGDRANKLVVRTLQRELTPVDTAASNSAVDAARASKRSAVEQGRSFDDQPFGADKLGIGVLAESIVKIHCPDHKDAMVPSNIALYAEWGGGKSFAKNKMKECFLAVNDTPECMHYQYCFEILEYNAWVFNGGDVIWAALINQLIDGVEGVHGKREFR